MLQSNECPQDECCGATNVHRTNVAEQRMSTGRMLQSNECRRRMSKGLMLQSNECLRRLLRDYLMITTEPVSSMGSEKDEVMIRKVQV